VAPTSVSSKSWKRDRQDPRAVTTHTRTHARTHTHTHTPAPQHNRALFTLSTNGVAVVTTMRPVKHRWPCMLGLGLVLGLFSALLGPARTWSPMFHRLQRRNNSHGLLPTVVSSSMLIAKLHQTRPTRPDQTVGRLGLVGSGRARPL